MGLDQYLYKKMSVGNAYKEPKEQVKIEVEGVKQERVTEITEEVIYWRKANQIHNWFTENCDFEENGGEVWVSKEKLELLLKTVNKVLKNSKLVKGKVSNGSTFENGKWVPVLVDGKVIENPKTAIELLPHQVGFFFGSSDYDEYYIEDLKHTKKKLQEVLKEEGNFYYSANW